MKVALRKGTAADLNVYITSLNNGGIIGCVLPRCCLKAQRLACRTL